MHDRQKQQMKEFKKLETLYQASEEGNIEHISNAINIQGLQEHEKAYTYVNKVIPNINLTNAQHQRHLFLAFNYLKKPYTWKNLPLADQRSLLAIESGRLAYENSQIKFKQTAFSTISTLGCVASIFSGGTPAIIGGVLGLSFGTLASREEPNQGITKKTLGYLSQEIYTSEYISTILEYPLAPDVQSFFSEIKIEGIENEQEKLKLKSKLQDNIIKTLRDSKAFLNASLENQNTINQEMQKLHQHIDEQGELQLHLGHEILQQIQPINNYIQQETEKAQRVRDTQESMEIFKGIHESFGVLGQIGRQSHSPELCKVAAIGQATTSLVFNAGQLTGSFGFTEVTGFGVLGPCAAIAMAGLSIFSCFSGSDENDHGLQEALQQITQQIQSLHIEMRQSFEQVFKNQQKIFEAIESVYHYMVQDSVRVHSKLDNITSNLQEFERITGLKIDHLMLQDLRKTVSLARDVQLTNDRQQEVLSNLKRWMIEESCLSSLNGAIYINNRNSAERINQVIRSVALENSLFNFLGFLAIQVKNYVGADNFPRDINVNKLPNIAVWQVAGQALLNLLENADEHVKQKYHSEIISHAEHTLKFMGYIRSNKKLFGKLLEKYYTAVNNIKELVKERENFCRNSNRGIENLLSINMREPLKDKITNEKKSFLEKLFPENSCARERAVLNKELENIDLYYNLIHIFAYLGENPIAEWSKTLKNTLLNSQELLQKKSYPFRNKFIKFPDEDSWIYQYCFSEIDEPIDSSEEDSSEEDAMVDSNIRGVVSTERKIKTHQKNISWLVYDGNFSTVSIQDYFVNSYQIRSRRTLTFKDKQYSLSPIYQAKNDNGIRLEVINTNGQDIFFLLIQSDDSIELYSHNPAVDAQGEWKQLKNGPSLAAGEYLTIHTNVLRIKQEGDIFQRLFLLGQNNRTDNVELHCYVPEKGKWHKLPALQKWKNGVKSTAQYQEFHYDTVRTEVMELNGHDCLLVMVRNKNNFEINCFDPETNQWTELPCLRNLGGQDWHQYYRTLRTAIVMIGKEKNTHSALLVIMHNKKGKEIHCYDPEIGCWEELPYDSHLKNNFYLKFLKCNDLVHDNFLSSFSFEQNNLRKLLTTKGQFWGQADRKSQTIVSEPQMLCNPVESTLYSVLMRIPAYQKKLLKLLGNQFEVDIKPNTNTAKNYENYSRHTNTSKYLLFKPSPDSSSTTSQNAANSAKIRKYRV